MDRQLLKRCLAEIGAESTVPGVIERLRAHLDAIGGRAWSSLPFRRGDELAAVAVELARLRLKRGASDGTLEAVEALFARASVRVSELLDRSEGWRVFQSRRAGPLAG